MRAWVEPNPNDEGLTISIFQVGLFYPYAEIPIEPAEWHMEFGLTSEEMSRIEVGTSE